MEKKPTKQNENEQLEMIRKLINSIQYGTISIIVQDGRIVQIEKNEKYRIKS